MTNIQIGCGMAVCAGAGLGGGIGMNRLLRTPLTIAETCRRTGFIVLTEEHVYTVKARLEELKELEKSSEAESKKEAQAHKDTLGLTVTLTKDTFDDADVKQTIEKCNALGKKWKDTDKKFKEEGQRFVFMCTANWEEINNRYRQVNAPIKGDKTLWKVTSDAGFKNLNIINKWHDAGNWLKIFKSNYPTSKLKNDAKKLELIKVECDTLRNSLFESDDEAKKHEWFKESIKKCTPLITLKDRAIQWGFKPIDTKDSKNNHWSSTASSASLISGESAKTADALIAACKKEEIKTHFEKDFETNWEKYLTSCTDSSTPTVDRSKLLKYDYWTKADKGKESKS